MGAFKVFSPFRYDEKHHHRHHHRHHHHHRYPRRYDGYKPWGEY